MRYRTIKLTAWGHSSQGHPTPSQGSANTPIRNTAVHDATNTGEDTDFEIIHESKTSNSLKALIGTAYRRIAVWAAVSSGGDFTDRVIYRCPEYGNATIPYNDITWSPDTLNWGRNYKITGLLATILDRSTVITFVTFKNMGK